MDELIEFISRNSKLLIFVGFIVYSVLASRKQMKKVNQNRPIPAPGWPPAPAPASRPPAPVPALRPAPRPSPAPAMAPTGRRPISPSPSRDAGKAAEDDEEIYLDEDAPTTGTAGKRQQPPADLGEFMEWLSQQGKKAVPRRPDAPSVRPEPKPPARTPPQASQHPPVLARPALSKITPPRQIPITKAKSLEQVLAESRTSEGSQSSEPSRAPVHLRAADTPSPGTLPVTTSATPASSISETAPALVTKTAPPAVLETLLHRGTTLLARAILAQEILGKPVSLR